MNLNSQDKSYSNYIIPENPVLENESQGQNAASAKWRITQAALLRVTPYAMAICFAILSLRGALHNDIYFSDASRHAMNGALIHDMVRSGHLATN